MAATEDMQDQELTTEEPAITATETSLEELKEMLVDIQINISNIFLGKKSIKNELAELTTTVREQKLEIVQLKTSLTKITKQCVDAEYELAAAKKRVNEQQDEIYELYELQDRLEQYTRKNSRDTWCARERLQHDRGGSIEISRSARSSYNSSGCRNFPQVETKRKQTNNC